MPEIISMPSLRRTKTVATKKCPYCKTVARYFEDDVWTEEGNTYARCAARVACDEVIFLGRLGRPDHV